MADWLDYLQSKLALSGCWIKNDAEKEKNFFGKVYMDQKLGGLWVIQRKNFTATLSDWLKIAFLKKMKNIKGVF